MRKWYVGADGACAGHCKVEEDTQNLLSIALAAAQLEHHVEAISDFSTYSQRGEVEVKHGVNLNALEYNLRKGHTFEGLWR